jgi:N6-L-threonylcarbamoyladenine synthase
LIVLGIETSCDDTGVAICRDGAILSNQINTQTIHQQYGGVVPELASREHEQRLNYLVAAALQEAQLELKDIHGIAVTHGPGLAGTLLTGVCFAKGLAMALECKLIAINHLEAHIFANFLAEPDLEFPFVCLLVSGGHTQLWHVKDLGQYTLLGTTRDDAAGEAFDKGARILGLGYPGGPKIESLARNGNSTAVDFPRSFMKPGNLEFSFSGLKTSLLYFMEAQTSAEKPLPLEDIAASYQGAILDILVFKLKEACCLTGVGTGVIAGGVAANQELRKKVNQSLPDVNIYYPEIQYCTDNGAMIAYLGELYFNRGKSSEPDFPIIPNLKLT